MNREELPTASARMRCGVLRRRRRRRRPFQIDRGLDRLLEAYRNAGGALITARDVHFYEVCIAAGWVCDVMASNDQAITTHAALPLQRLLRKVGAA